MRRFEMVAAANRSQQWGLGRGRVSRAPFRTKLLLVTFLGVLIGSFGAWFAFPGIAKADTCANYVNHYHAESNDTDTTHYGVKVANPGMYIYDHAIGCVEVSSIAIVHVGGDQAEIGWDQIANGVSICNATGDGSERVLTTWTTAHTYHCALHGTLTPNQSDEFDVWADSSSCSGGLCTWHYDHDGAHPQVATLDFSTGTAFNNGERLSSYDSAQSQFNGLQVGHDTTWSDWAGASCYYDDDPTYSPKILSSTDVNVSSAGNPC